MLDWRSRSPKLINSLLENGYLPVVSSIGVTDEGQLMNVNADQRQRRWRQRWARI